MTDINTIIKSADERIQNLTGTPCSLLLLRLRERRRISIDKVINAASKYFNQTPAAIKGKSRKAQIVSARMYVSYYLYIVCENHTLSAIGEGMGGRDHATIINHIRKMEDEMSYNKNLRNDFAAFCEFANAYLENY